MKVALPLVCLFAVTACAPTPRTGYVKPIGVLVEYEGGNTGSLGIPWGDFVIATAHQGWDVAAHPATTTIWTSEGPQPSVGLPVFSKQNDWCLLRPSKPVECAKLELSWKPWSRMYVVLTPRDGGDTHLVRCRPGKSPTKEELSRAGSPASQPASSPSDPAAMERAMTFGRRIAVLTDEPIRPGNSGSPVVFFDPWTREFTVCGMIVGAFNQLPTRAEMLPFWDGIGAELLEERKQAEKEATATTGAHAEEEKGGDQTP
jgi:hypothetical protein